MQFRNVKTKSVRLKTKIKRIEKLSLVQHARLKQINSIGKELRLSKRMASPHHRNPANSAPPAPCVCMFRFSGKLRGRSVWERAGVAMRHRRELERCRRRRRRHQRRRDNLIGRRLQSSLMTRSARRGYCVVVRPFLL